MRYLLITMYDDPSGLLKHVSIVGGNLDVSTIILNILKYKSFSCVYFEKKICKKVLLL